MHPALFFWGGKMSKGEDGYPQKYRDIAEVANTN